MAIRRKYADGWGPIVLRDVRLRGWGQLSIAAPLGSRAVLVSAKRKVSEEDGFREPCLNVVVEITRPDGDAYEINALVRRPHAEQLGSLEKVSAYLDAIAGDGDLEQLVLDHADNALDFDPTRHLTDKHLCKHQQKGGLPLTSWQIFMLAEAIIDWRKFQLDKVKISEEYNAVGLENITLTRSDLSWFAWKMFNAGRVARQSEIPAAKSRHSSANSSSRRSEAAEAWWDAGAEWEQCFVGSYPDGWGTRRKSMNALAEVMADKWNDRPFKPGGPEEVSVADLQKRVLPIWKADGMIKL